MLKNPTRCWLVALCPMLMIAAVNPALSHADDPPALGSSAPEPIVTETNSTTQTSQPAEPKVDSVTREHVEENNDPNATRFSLFGGAGLGYSWLTDNVDSNKKGLNAEGRITGALYSPKIAFDLGLGWLYSRLSGSSTSSLTGLTTDTTIITQAGFVDLSPRYRFANSHLELGLLGRVMFGTNTDFGPVDTQSGAQVFIGPKATWAWLDEDIQYRLGLQLITDLTITDRQVWMPLLSFEIGIPLFKSKTVVRETETTRTEYVDKIVEKEKIVEKIVPSEAVLVFDDEVVHFEIAKATLYPESRKFFAEVGRYLAGNQGLWKTLKVSGHTDATGNANDNLKLSKQRAGSVARVLVASGVPASKIKTAGYGETRPVDPGNTPVAYARNRRVEISFGEGANSKQLHDEINRIKLRTIKPRTCEGDRCK